MSKSNMNAIKQQSAEVHGYLIRLVNQAHENFYRNPQDDKKLLSVDKNLHKKYNRFRFVFDPNKASEYLPLFEEAFAAEIQQDPNNKKKPLAAIFAELKATHPFGVEIWINPSDASTSPLVENVSELAIRQIYSAAKMMLTDLQQVQGNASTSRWRKEYDGTLALLEQEYQAAIAAIQQFYEEKPASSKADKDAQHKALKQIVQDFQHATAGHITRVATLNKPDGATQQDYTASCKLLSQYEQVRTSAADPVSDPFKRDILSLDIKVEQNHCITAAKFTAYKRNYTLSEQQRQYQQTDVSAAGSEPTQTAHTDGIGLPNYARVDEGSYANGQAKVDLSFKRFGSPARSEKIADIHESTLTALLNMEQDLQNDRFEVIKALLPQQTFLNTTQKHDFVQKLSVAVSELLHQHALTNQPVNSVNIVKQALQQVIVFKMQLEVNPDIQKFAQKLAAHAEEIVDIKSFHTHLITPVGPGSIPNKQGQQFCDMKIAQYGTAVAGQTAIYTCFAVNEFRFGDNALGDPEGKSSGNNCAGLVQLYAALPPLTGMKKVDLTAFEQQLTKIRTSAKMYLNAIPAYLQTKKEHKELKQNIHRQQQAFDQGSINLAEFNAFMSKVKPSLLAKEAALLKQKAGLDALRNDIDKNEFTLYQQAGKATTAIYKELTDNVKTIDNLANDHEKRAVYLAYQSFYEAQKLFNDTNMFGVEKWKLAENNGVIQPLINLCAEHSGVFSSIYCKSNNDRTFAAACNETELGNRVAQPGRLNVHGLAKAAQKNYATHSSHALTALDGSGITKVKSLLPYADKGTVKDFSRYESFASHKRYHEHDDVQLTQNSSAIVKERDEIIYSDWLKTSASKTLPNITQLLHALCNTRDDATKLELLQTVTTAIKAYHTNSRHNRNKDMDNAIGNLSDTLQSRAYELRADPSSQHKQLKGFLDLVHALRTNISPEVQQVLKKYSPEKEYQLSELLAVFMQLRHAQPNTAGRNSPAATMFFSNAQKQPLWQLELKNIFQQDIGSPGFNLIAKFEAATNLVGKLQEIIVQPEPVAGQNTRMASVAG